MIYSFTGPTRLTDTQLAYVREILRGLRDHNPEAEWRSGGAYGVDTEVAIHAPAGRLTLVLPQGHWHNSALVSIPRATVQYVEGGYRKRNEALVAGADTLHACIKHEDFYRSGEWMTLNIAKRVGVPVVQWIIPDRRRGGH